MESVASQTHCPSRTPFSSSQIEKLYKISFETSNTGYFAGIERKKEDAHILTDLSSPAVASILCIFGFHATQLQAAEELWTLCFISSEPVIVLQM
jgi:hypothetical protein